jgi:type 1 glutamine amidotransferase
LTATTSNLHVLIITGGRSDFEREAFYEMFNTFANVDYREVSQPEANRKLTSSFYDAFDVLVFYDMVQDITDQQKAAFIHMLQQGKGVLFLHHALASYREWDEYENIIGGRFYLDLQPDLKDKTDYPVSTYQHDVDIPVSIVAKNHPVTSGLNDFVIHDETYGNFKVLPRVHPLLSTSHPASDDIIGWTHSYGKSSVVYIQPGHNHSAFQNPNYRRLVEQAIRWVYDQLKQ